MKVFLDATGAVVATHEDNQSVTLADYPQATNMILVTGPFNYEKIYTPAEITVGEAAAAQNPGATDRLAALEANNLAQLSVGQQVVQALVLDYNNSYSLPNIKAAVLAAVTANPTGSFADLLEAAEAGL